MDNTINPPVIASAFDYLSSNFDSCAPVDLPHSDMTSSSNNVGSPDVEKCSSEMQKAHSSNQLASATGFSTLLPVCGTPNTSSITATSPFKPQMDENRHIAPLPLRSSASASSIISSTVSLQPRANENMPPPPLPIHNTRGKKRKSIPDETATPSEPKKHCKSRLISDKQKQKQEVPEVNSSQDLPVTLRHEDSSYNNQSSTHDVNPTDSIAAQLNESHAIQHPPAGITDYAQHFQRLVSTHGLPGIVPVSITEEYPARISEMMLSIRDPQSQCIVSVYFVPYLWFPDDPKRPYRLRKDDRCFWGKRIYEYHNRVQCGRIAFTVNRSPVLFFGSEEKEKIDRINYQLAVEIGAITLPTASADTSSSLDALHTGDQPLSNIEHNAAEQPSMPTEAGIDGQYHQSFLLSTRVINPFMAQTNNNNETDAHISTLDFNVPSVVQQSFPALSNSVCDPFHEFQFNNHNGSASSTNPDTLSDLNFGVNHLPPVEEPSFTDIPQSPSEFNFTSGTFSQCHIDNNRALSTRNDDGFADFTFNINDLPGIQETASNDIFQPLSELTDLAPNPSPLDMPQYKNIDYTPSNINPDPLSDFAFNTNNPSTILNQSFSTEPSQIFYESEGLGPSPSLDVPQFNIDNSDTNTFFDFNYGADGTSNDSIVDPLSNDTAQYFPELEAMYTKFNWSEAQDAQLSTPNP